MDNSSISARDFQQVKELGSGSFGRVTLVRKKDDQKLYAIKSVLLSRLNQKEKESALNEVRLLASIRIPYVISYKGAYFDSISQTLCVVMEYADGGDLQQKITKQMDEGNQQGLQEHYVWKVAYELLNALKKLHQKKIVHRDIKTANVFFVNDIAKLGDLNVSKVADKGWLQTHTGTPYYTSPEIWNGQRYTAKCDIWSLGCLLYEMCTLHSPFKATDFPTLFRKVIVGEYQQIANKYSQDLKDFIRMCLTVDDEKRPSAATLLETSILSGMELTLQIFRYEGEQEIQLIDPIKCPRVLKFLNNRLPKTQFDRVPKKNITFVTKQEIETQKGESPKLLRKILSQKVIKRDFSETSSKLKRIGSKKNIKLPPLDGQDKDTEAKFLTFSMKKTKSGGSKLKIEGNKENLRL